MAGIGTVDPFRLELVERPPGSGVFVVLDPDRDGPAATLEMAGLSLAGAGQALLALSMRWMARAGKEITPEEPPLPVGEVRMVVRRREARLLASLLRRHLDRLPQPPGWMPGLLKAFEEIDEFLRWEDR